MGHPQKIKSTRSMKLDEFFLRKKPNECLTVVKQGTSMAKKTVSFNIEPKDKTKEPTLKLVVEKQKAP